MFPRNEIIFSDGAGAAINVPKDWPSDWPRITDDKITKLISAGEEIERYYKELLSEELLKALAANYEKGCEDIIGVIEELLATDEFKLRAEVPREVDAFQDFSQFTPPLFLLGALPVTPGVQHSVNLDKLEQGISDALDAFIGSERMKELGVPLVPSDKNSPLNFHRICIESVLSMKLGWLLAHLFLKGLQIVKKL